MKISYSKKQREGAIARQVPLVCIDLSSKHCLDDAVQFSFHGAADAKQLHTMLALFLQQVGKHNPNVVETAPNDTAPSREA